MTVYVDSEAARRAARAIAPAKTTSIKTAVTKTASIETAPTMTAPAKGVRRATPADAAAVEAMLRAIGPESPVFRDTPIDDRKLKAFIAAAIASDQHAMLLHESAAGIDGLFIGVLVEQFFTLEINAMDIVLYVPPERRGTRAALRLWRAFKIWAQARNAKAIQVGSMTGIDPARTAKFYRGMGLREVGSIFHMRLD